MTDARPTEAGRGGFWTGRRVLLALVAVAALAGLFFFGRSLVGLVPRFAEWVEGLGGWGPAAFVGGYLLATVALVPGSALTLLAGAVFGLVRGTLYVLLGATLGATAAFLVARYLARPAVRKRVEKSPRFAGIDRAIGDQGWKLVLLLRLSPLIPFNLLNYGLGVTRVRLSHYLIGSIGMVPGTVLYVYYGRVAGEVAAAAGGTSRGVEYYALLGLGLLATIAATWMVTRAARRELERRTDDQPA